jgi:hypothetical protein
VQAFVRDRAAVDSAGHEALGALKPGGLLFPVASGGRSSVSGFPDISGLARIVPL